LSQELSANHGSIRSPVEIITQRKVNLKEINSSVEKFVSKIPAYIVSLNPPAQGLEKKFLILF
jgi:hypothetical protein